MGVHWSRLFAVILMNTHNVFGIGGEKNCPKIISKYYLLSGVFALFYVSDNILILFNSLVSCDCYML